MRLAGWHRSVLAVLLLASVAGRLDAQPTLAPVDQGTRDESFAAFRVRLQHTIELRDSAGLMAVIDPAIKIPDGVPDDRIAIERDGTVRANGTIVGKLQVVTVRATSGLLPVGDNAFVATAASGPTRNAPAQTQVTQGALEASNTDMAQAMVDMIDAQRTFQMTSKAIQTADSMMEIANGVKR